MNTEKIRHNTIGKGKQRYKTFEDRNKTISLCR